MNTKDRQGPRPLLVVLTGGVASGKTTASDCFARLGVEVIDTDLIAREMVEPGGPALLEIAEHFGPGILTPDGSLDRRMLRNQVFANERSRKQLEAILHPLIETRVRERIAEAGTEPYVLVVVPLLVETGLFADADRVIVVDVPEETQLRRLRERDDVDARHAQAMLAAQASRKERLAAADEVLDNTATRPELEKAVRRLHGKLLKKAAHCQQQSCD